MKLFTVPNLITLGNLLCGCVAIVFAFNGNLAWAAYLVGIAAVLDFLDGFVARALKQYSPVGKDLDSLADMVTFGVVPGVVMFQLMRAALIADDEGLGMWGMTKLDLLAYPLAFVAFLITLFSALRLAKFNNDTRQSDSFIGVPTPANSILICSFPLIATYINNKYSGDIVGFDQAVFSFIINPWVLTGITLIMSYLLISEIPLFALKFKSFKWKGNEIRYSFLAAAVIMLVLLKFIALPLIIVLYVLMSVVNNVMKRNEKKG
jgi:CDP-diacylglycerol--serine O-phosphatidyltransferase